MLRFGQCLKSIKGMNKDHVINYCPIIKARCYLVAEGLVQVALAQREKQL